MDIEEIKSIKCKGCSDEFAINAIKQHLNKKPLCKKKYSEVELDDLCRLCETSRKEKERKRKREYYHKRQNTMVKEVRFV